MGTRALARPVSTSPSESESSAARSTQYTNTEDRADGKTVNVGSARNATMALHCSAGAAEAPEDAGDDGWRYSSNGGLRSPGPYHPCATSAFRFL